MVNLDTQSIANELSYYGNLVTVRNVVSTYNERGDPSEVTSDLSKTAFVQILTQEDQLVKEGTFRMGDKLFWFKGNESGISRGNRIFHANKWYQIVETIEHEVAGIIFITEARTRKI